MQIRMFNLSHLRMQKIVNVPWMWRGIPDTSPVCSRNCSPGWASSFLPPSLAHYTLRVLHRIKGSFFYVQRTQSKSCRKQGANEKSIFVCQWRNCIGTTSRHIVHKQWWLHAAWCHLSMQHAKEAEAQPGELFSLHITYTLITHKAALTQHMCVEYFQLSTVCTYHNSWGHPVLQEIK